MDIQLDVSMKALRLVFRILGQLPSLSHMRLSIELEADDLVDMRPVDLGPIFPPISLKKLEVVLKAPYMGHELHDWVCRAFYRVNPTAQSITFAIDTEKDVRYRVANVITNSEQLACLINCRWFRNKRRVSEAT
jgi:hypothetical protein